MGGFESDVILEGTQTGRFEEVEDDAFESDVILEGTQPAST